MQDHQREESRKGINGGPGEKRESKKAEKERIVRGGARRRGPLRHKGKSGGTPVKGFWGRERNYTSVKVTKNLIPVKTVILVRSNYRPS